MPEDLFDKLVDWNMADDWFVRGPKEKCEEFEALDDSDITEEDLPF